MKVQLDRNAAMVCILLILQLILQPGLQKGNVWPTFWTAYCQIGYQPAHPLISM